MECCRHEEGTSYRQAPVSVPKGIDLQGRLPNTGKSEGSSRQPNGQGFCTLPSVADEETEEREGRETSSADPTSVTAGLGLSNAPQTVGDARPGERVTEQAHQSRRAEIRQNAS